MADIRCKVCKMRFTAVVWCGNAGRAGDKKCPYTDQAEATPVQRDVLLMDEEFRAPRFDDDGPGRRRPL